MAVAEQTSLTAATGRTRLLAACVLSCLTLCLALTGAARAQTPDNSASFITPFPDKDTYRVMVFGDSLADGLVQGLNEAFEADEKLEVSKKTKPASSFARREPFDWATQIKDVIGKDNPHIAVILFGVRERQPFVNVRTEEMERRRDLWRADFGKRVDLFLKTLRRGNVAIYWVGAPIMKSTPASEDLQLINTVFREKVYLNGGKFIDTWNGFTDQNGQYNQLGPDLSGKIRQLRESDGIHFTQAGYRKLAHFVEREIRRDLVIAKAERSIPLAGTEAEQRRVNPVRLQRTAPATAPVATTSSPRMPPTRNDPKQPPVESEPALTDQKAENSKVTFLAPAIDGKKPEQVTIEIIRPSIPAQVIAHVTRRKETQKAQQIGETVPTQSISGLTSLSTITTAPSVTASVTRRNPSSTDALPYRVMIKGERLPSKAGRADDFTWPRAEPPPPG